MTDIDWSKVPEGAQYYSASDDGFYTFYRNIEESTYEIFYCGGTRWIFHVGTPKERYTIIPRPAPVWNGEGLPPVGAKCRIITADTPWWEYSGLTDGETVTVHHSFKNSKGCDMVVVEACNGACLTVIVECLAPIRTPEQIAADEREAAIDEIINDATNPMDEKMLFRNYPGTAFIRQLAECIYNAGYRKPC